MHACSQVVDASMRARLAWPAADGSSGSGSSSGGGLVASLHASLDHDGPFPVSSVSVQGARGRVSVENFIMPVFGHTVTLELFAQPLMQPVHASAAEARGAYATDASGEALFSATPAMAGNSTAPAPTTASITAAAADGGRSLKSLFTAGQEKERPAGPPGMAASSPHASPLAKGAAVQQRVTYRVYGDGDSSYYHQLQRFAQDVRRQQQQQKLLDGASSSAAGAGTDLTAAAAPLEGWWCMGLGDEADALANMHVVDEVYRAAGLPLRKPSTLR